MKGRLGEEPRPVAPGAPRPRRRLRSMLPLGGREGGAKVRGVVTAVAAVGGYAALYRLGQTWGAGSLWSGWSRTGCW